jgi:hypothetical protein
VPWATASADRLRCAERPLIGCFDYVTDGDPEVLDQWSNPQREKLSSASRDPESALEII